jgi:replication initiator protein RepSA
MSFHTAGSMADGLAPGATEIEQAIRRAASPGYEAWWRRCAAVGFCANPIQATATDPDSGRPVAVMIRCGNRRAAICPSCSDLYAADTWQLIHAGTHGGHHGLPPNMADRPQVFATLTAPSYGPVHTSSDKPEGPGRACHPPTTRRTMCPHGNPVWCSRTHRDGDPEVGQPLCPDCYDYTGHVLFNWHAPELWRRFTIALRRTLARHLRAAGADPDTVRVSFVKVAEYQRRAIIHYHTVIRLDPTTEEPSVTGESEPVVVSAVELAGLVRAAAGEVRLPVETAGSPGAASEARMLRFGAQIDTQPLTASNTDTAGSTPGLARRVAGYLAKYTTKSVAEFGIAARRISPHAIADLDIPAHARRILTTLTRLAALPGNAPMLGWLHTLGYRGHITTKSLRYSVTLGALRAARRHWRQHHGEQPEYVGCQHNPPDQRGRSTVEHELVGWRVQGCGHRDDGERLLVHTAAHHAREQRYLARLHDRDHTGASP